MTKAADVDGKDPTSYVEAIFDIDSKKSLIAMKSTPYTPIKYGLYLMYQKA